MGSLHRLTALSPIPVRRKRRRRFCTAAVLLAAVAGLVAGCSASHADAPSAPGHQVGTKIADPQPLPAGIAHLPLRDSQGHSVSLASYRGKVVVISDILTLCQETCPMETTNLVAAARAVDNAGLADKVEFLTITVDPQRDTPKRLAAYRTFFAKPNQLPNWDLLTGKPADIHRLWKYFGVFVKKTKEPTPPATDWLTHEPLTYDVAHSDLVIFLDGHGRERFEISGPADVAIPSKVPSPLRGFLDHQGDENLKHPGSLAWTPQQVQQVVGWLTGTRIGVIAG